MVYIMAGTVPSVRTVLFNPFALQSFNVIEFVLLVDVSACCLGLVSLSFLRCLPCVDLLYHSLYCHI